MALRFRERSKFSRFSLLLFFLCVLCVERFSPAAAHESLLLLACEKKVARIGSRKKNASGEVAMPPTTTRASGCRA